MKYSLTFQVVFKIVFDRNKLSNKLLAGLGNVQLMMIISNHPPSYFSRQKSFILMVKFAFLSQNYAREDFYGNGRVFISKYFGTNICVWQNWPKYILFLFKPKANNEELILFGLHWRFHKWTKQFQAHMLACWYRP